MSCKVPLNVLSEFAIPTDSDAVPAAELLTVPVPESPSIVSMKPFKSSTAGELTFRVALSAITLLLDDTNVPETNEIVPVPALRLLMDVELDALRNWLPFVEFVLVERLVEFTVIASPDAAMFPADVRLTGPPVMSEPTSPPSVISPVRAVSVTVFEPAFSSVTAIEPPLIVTESLNVELSTSTAPLPLAASPIVIELKPSCRKPSSVSFRFSVPAPPPSPIVVDADAGASVRLPLDCTGTASEIVLAVMEMLPVVRAPPMADPAPKAFSPTPLPALAFAVSTIAPLPVVVITAPPLPKLASRIASLPLPTPETPLIVTVPLTAETVTPANMSTPKLAEPVEPPVPFSVMLPEPVVVTVPPMITPSWN